MLRYLRAGVERAASATRPHAPGVAGRLVAVSAALQSRGLVPVAPAVARPAVRPRRRILCDPRALRYRMVLSKVFAANRYRPVLDPACAHDAAIGVPSPAGRFVVNAGHRGNEKTRVADAWERASGRALAVDPATHAGPMVEKADANATHDGKVRHGPLAADAAVPGQVYQRLVDNADGDDVVDLRVPFVGGRIPFVYRKRRPLARRFAQANASVELLETDAVFTLAEQDTLLRFVALVGLDFGEADVLRDRNDGSIWAVDVTNGPGGPPNGLARREARRAVARLAAAFEAMLEEQAG